MAISGAHEPAQSTHDLTSWRAALRGGVSVWALCTAGYLLVATVVEAAGLDPHRYPHSPLWSKPFRLYARGDAGHFLNIARYGYWGRHSDGLAAAYFPGYPLAGRTLARLTSIGQPRVTTYLVTLAVVAWVGTAAAAVLLWRLVATASGPRVASAAVVALLAGPYSVFLVASYSEGMFLGLALGAWVAARADRWLLASVLASLAALTRVSGLFLGCALVVMFVQSRGHRSLGRQAVSLATPFVAVLGYFGWLHQHTGSWSTWFDVERLGWGRHTVAPWSAFTNSVRRLSHLPSGRQQWALGFQDSMELVFAAGFVLAVVVLIRRRRWPEATYVGLTALSLLTSAYYLSVPRSMVICFPVWILAGEWASSTKRRWLLLLTVGCSVLVAFINASSMLSDHWSG